MYHNRRAVYGIYQGEPSCIHQVRRNPKGSIQWPHVEKMSFLRARGSIRDLAIPTPWEIPNEEVREEKPSVEDKTK